MQVSEFLPRPAPSHGGSLALPGEASRAGGAAATPRLPPSGGPCGAKRAPREAEAVQHLLEEGKTDADSGPGSTGEGSNMRT